MTSLYTYVSTMQAIHAEVYPRPSSCPTGDFGPALCARAVHPQICCYVVHGYTLPMAPEQFRRIALVLIVRDSFKFAYLNDFDF